MKKNDFFSSVGRLALAMLVLWLAACTSNSPAPVVARGQQVTPTRQPAGAYTYTVKPGDTLYSIAREHGLDFRELIALNAIENPDQIEVGRVLRIRSRSDSLGATDVAVTAPVTTGVVVARPIGETSGVGTNPESRADSEILKREPKAGKEVYSEQALAAARSQGQPASATEARPGPTPDEKPVVPAPAVAVSGDDVPWIWPANGKIVGTFNESGTKGLDIAGKAGDPVLAAGDGKVVYSGTGLRGYGKLVIIKHNATYLSAYAHNREILVKEGQSVTQGQKIAEMGNTDADQVKLHFEVRRMGKPVDPLKHLPPR
ncbi:peptidase [Betaproteobacteria bacterium]|nr:peptidase [Betaproteobacteria bacterium]